MFMDVWGVKEREAALKMAKSMHVKSFATSWITPQRSVIPRTAKGNEAERNPSMGGVKTAGQNR